jgi:hypothetical protein
LASSTSTHGGAEKRRTADRVRAIEQKCDSGGWRLHHVGDDWHDPVLAGFDAAHVDMPGGMVAGRGSLVGDPDPPDGLDVRIDHDAGIEPAERRTGRAAVDHRRCDVERQVFTRIDLEERRAKEGEPGRHRRERDAARSGGRR